MSIANTIQSVLVPINRAGWPFIGGFAAATLALSFFSESLGLIGAVLTAWCAYFFRDPDRVTPVRDGLFVSPADGVVQLIDEAPPPDELEMGDQPRPRICVFMNVFNVHVNRSPCDGRVVKSSYRPGHFINASLDKASEFNERRSLRIHPEKGDAVAVVQIAGLVARRILTFAREGDHIKAGERFGLIRFGSRVDVYLPNGVRPVVVPGQIAVAGETVIADVLVKDDALHGEVR